MSPRLRAVGVLCGCLAAAPNTYARADELLRSSSTNFSAGELRALHDELGSRDGRTRAEALRALSTLGGDALAPLGARIDALRSTFDGAAVVAKIAAFRASAGVGTAGGVTLDRLEPQLLGALAAHPDRDALVAVEWLAYARALETQRTPEAAELAVGKLLALDKNLAAAEGPGVIERLGVVAIPALLRGRVHPRPWLRAVCEAGLKASGYDVPGRAVQQDDAHLLSSILEVYGDVLAFDAMAVTVSYAVDERWEVRAAALRSIHRYGRNAIWQLRERYLNVVGKDAPAEWDYKRVLAELTREHAAPQLAVHTQAVKMAHEALAGGDAKGALNALNPALFLDATDERAAELSSLLLAIGDRALAKRDALLARASFARALRTEPDGADAARLRARLAFLDAENLAGSGFLDMNRYERAAELDPRFAPAQAALDELSGRAEERDAWLRRSIAGLAGLFLAAGAAFWLRSARAGIAAANDPTDESAA